MTLYNEFGYVCQELGRAEGSMGRELKLAEAYCEPTGATLSDLEPRDWILAVCWSEGKVCLKFEEMAETAYISCDEDGLIANIQNDVFLRRQTVRAQTGDVESLIEKYQPKAVTRDKTPFSEGVDDA